MVIMVSLIPGNKRGRDISKMIVAYQVELFRRKQLNQPQLHTRKNEVMSRYSLEYTLLSRSISSPEELLHVTH